MTRPGVFVVGVGQLLAGAFLLARPGPVTARIAGAPSTEPPVWLVRVLGARMAVQGLTEAVWPTRRAARCGATVDLLHALSMAAVAVGSRRFRRPALTSMAVAAASAAVLDLTARAAGP